MVVAADELGDEQLAVAVADEGFGGAAHWGYLDCEMAHPMMTPMLIRAAGAVAYMIHLGILSGHRWQSWAVQKATTEQR